ncbi:MAG: NUDIX hydrolase [Blastocatellia bacterium]|jgi:ADP-ribose pyrophosphatase|nr:NUDIX hydrolase [Blastocatellia bacterium]
MKPVVTASDTIYNGRIFDIRTDSIREGDIEYKREIVIHKGSAVVVPVFDDGTVALVRQYRHAAKEFLLEIPAGTLNAGEDPKLGAIRELEEEIGVTAENIEKLTEFYVSPGFLTEKMHVFLATGLIDVGQKLEADELLTVERHSFDELNKMIRNGEITDAKTMLGIMLAEEKFRSIAR